MSAAIYWLVYWALVNVVTSSVESNTRPRQLDPISGGDVLRRDIDEVKDSVGMERAYASTGSSRPRRPSHIHSASSGTLDPLGGGNLVRRLAHPSTAEVFRTLAKLASDQYYNNIDELKDGEFSEALNRLARGQLARSLDSGENSDFLAFDEGRSEENNFPYRPHKRTLDSLSGMSFGEMKRMIPLSGLSKRNFDEIDNVGFNNWAKRPYTKPTSNDTEASPRMHSLALARRNYGGPLRYQMSSLAKKNYGGPLRYQMSSLAKKNFDEIDRTGFEGFSKREVKETP